MKEMLKKTEASALITETRKTLSRLGCSFADFAMAAGRSEGTVKNWLYGAVSLSREQEGLIRNALTLLKEQRNGGFLEDSTMLMAKIERAAFEAWRDGSEEKSKLIMNAAKVIQKKIDEINHLFSTQEGGEA